VRRWLKWLGLGLALAAVILTFVNASWLAPDPEGSPKLIAHRGLYQLYDREGLERDTCTADRIYEPYHGYLENTPQSVLRSFNMGAHMVEIDIAPTKDGEVVVWHDWTLDCRTEGAGPVRDATLEELQSLDIGYGYTADGGETFPFRGGAFVGAMPTFEELGAQLPPNAHLMINFKSKHPEEADLIAAKFAAMDRDPAEAGDAFYGHEGPIGRIRELFPEAWSWNTQNAKQCSQDYVLYGWSGYLPQSCRGETLLVPLNYQWAFWGWPNRLIARMEEHGGRVVVIGPIGDNLPRGLTLPEQVEEIPSSFNGYVWIEDAFTIAPALRPSLDDRDAAEVEASEAALDARRARQ